MPDFRLAIVYLLRYSSNCVRLRMRSDETIRGNRMLSIIGFPEFNEIWKTDSLDRIADIIK